MECKDCENYKPKESAFKKYTKSLCVFTLTSEMIGKTTEKEIIFQRKEGWNAALKEVSEYLKSELLEVYAGIILDKLKED